MSIGQDRIPRHLMAESLTRDAEGHVLCELASVPDPSSRGFTLPWQGRALDLLLVRRDDQIAAYVNSCPHTGASLDWIPDQFLDAEGEHIQCATHGALFRLQDGYCVSGPCAGQSLTPLAVEILNGWVVVTARP